MSISTQRGDQGQTRLLSGQRVSKTHLRVEAYGTIDELNSIMGFARSLCEDVEICELVKKIQTELFTLSSLLAVASNYPKKLPAITTDMVETLTKHVHHIETMEGILLNWALPGEHTVSATFDMARTVCRRAERHIIRLVESGEIIDPNILPYVNRLSDLLWLLGRLLELRAGIEAKK